MKIATYLLDETGFITEKNTENVDAISFTLVIGFGSRELLESERHFELIKNKFPNAKIVLSSTAGEIFGKEVLDDTISLVAINFADTEVVAIKVGIKDFSSSFEAGKHIITQLNQTKDLQFVFVLSDGNSVNGSELVKGLNEANHQNVLITGGLAGDKANFEKTVIGLDELPTSDNIVGIGFYGTKLALSHGSFGGWESFGLERVVTKSSENVLYEIDNKIALDLYKNYLGKYATELPGSALLFPLSIILPNNTEPIVRTILSVDEQNQSMTFAGDLPVGSRVRFMKVNFDRLIEAANQAAMNCKSFENDSQKLSILISCVGRKLVLGNRIEEEVEAVEEVFGDKNTLFGFYSYGEISPLNVGTKCELHNQTMTITCINEIP